MKLKQIAALIGCAGLFLFISALAGSVLASGTKTTTSTTNTKPADLLDSKDLAGQLLPEGKKIEIAGTLSKGNGERFILTSKDTQKAYTILENSLLESMKETFEKNSKVVFRATARVTVFDNKNYLFITKVALAE